MPKNKKWIVFPQTEYQVWYGLRRRCYDPHNSSFARYGGRGIGVCERWRNNFAAFFSDMGLRPSPRHSLDRRDNDGDYSPENCRWTTRAVQQRNRESVLRAGGTVRAGDCWRAKIQINGRSIALGRFETEAEASRVYREAAIQALITTELLTAALESLSQNERCANCGFTGPHTLAAQVSFDPSRRGLAPQRAASNPLDHNSSRRLPQPAWMARAFVEAEN